MLFSLRRNQARQETVEIAAVHCWQKQRLLSFYFLSPVWGSYLLWCLWVSPRWLLELQSLHIDMSWAAGKQMIKEWPFEMSWFSVKTWNIFLSVIESHGHTIINETRTWNDFFAGWLYTVRKTKDGYLEGIDSCCCINCHVHTHLFVFPVQPIYSELFISGSFTTVTHLSWFSKHLSFENRKAYKSESWQALGKCLLALSSL